MIIFELLWDDGNVRHIVEDNGIRPQEVDEAVVADPVLFRRLRNKMLVVGRTQGGRFISVILEPKGDGEWRPVTARQSDTKETRWARELLDKRRKGGR